MGQESAEIAGISRVEDEKAAVRSAVFNHLAGIVIAPTVKVLSDRGVLELFHHADEWVELDRVVQRTRGNRAYLKIALRLLASCGWLKQRSADNGQSPAYAATEEGAVAFKIAPPLYAKVVSFVPNAIFLEDFMFRTSPRDPVFPLFRDLVSQAQEQWRIGSLQSRREDRLLANVHARVRKHLDGVLVGPVMVALARGHVFEQLEQGPLRVTHIAANSANLDCALDLLATQGWIVRERDRFTFTSCGRYAAQIATSYGVTVSYLPLFNLLSTLIFGNPRMPRIDESGVELLVNRAMNVWGSGGAHRTYFKRIDEVVVEIFNRPVESQPQGICDMGCGDGTLLDHLYSVVKNRTARGRMLDTHPLILVGADFNKVARRVTKQTLRSAGIPKFHVVPGDISRPAQLAGDLEKIGLDIHDLLHVRSFLDHNRIYSPPVNYVQGTRQARTTGAFARLSEEVLPDELEENLVRHLRRWAPYVGRFGLLVLELHTLPPEITAANLDSTPAVAYDGTHGFSDQYLVELPIFFECAKEAGLHADPKHQFRFPSSELATVSINFFTAPSSAPLS